jgi:hypothetical protein
MRDTWRGAGRIGSVLKFQLRTPDDRGLQTRAYTEQPSEWIATNEKILSMNNIS